jgi:hypothetical protein
VKLDLAENTLGTSHRHHDTKPQLLLIGQKELYTSNWLMRDKEFKKREADSANLGPDPFKREVML